MLKRITFFSISFLLTAVFLAGATTLFPPITEFFHCKPLPSFFGLGTLVACLIWIPWLAIATHDDVPIGLSSGMILAVLVMAIVIVGSMAVTQQDSSSSILVGFWDQSCKEAFFR